jgi:predicted Ser/Thr protein kinase
MEGGNLLFMYIQEIEKWVSTIKVTNMVNADVEVVNTSPLVMMGKGRQGAVFQLTQDICVKVFGNVEDCDREYYALSLGQHTNLFPRLYGKGPLYIAMEIIRGVDLREYLQSQPLTPALSAKLIEMLITFKQIGYERIDHHKRQIYIQPDGSLKVIDVARTVWRDRVYPYPRKLLNSLGDENKAVFLAFVQEMAPELFAEWLHYIHMEEISRKITELLLPQEPDKQLLNNLSKGLLTTHDEKNYVTLLHGLVHKVFKEEWVKLMLARGANIEEVMAKIDEYWDNRELAAQGKQDTDNRSGDDYSEGRFRGEKRFEGERDSRRGRNYEGGKRFQGERYYDHDRNQDREKERDKDRDKKKDKKHDKDRKKDKDKKKKDKKK